MNSEISVLLVDDHGLVRKGFRRMLEDDPEIRVVGEATNGQEAIKLAQATKDAAAVTEYQARKALYEAGKPYHESP